MSDVKRYDIEGGEYGITLYRSTTGQFVDYADYAYLRARVAELEAQISTGDYDYTVDEICNAYESGVGHRGRPTAHVNPYKPGSDLATAYAIGAVGDREAQIAEPAADANLHVAIEMLESVLCDLTGERVIRGSDGDRRQVDAALAYLRKLSAAPAAAVPDGYRLQPLSEYEAMRLALDMPEGDYQKWKELVIADLQTSYDTDGITHEDSGDPLIYLQSAIAIVEEALLPEAARQPSQDVVRDANRYRVIRGHLGHVAWKDSDNALIGVGVAKTPGEPYRGNRVADFDAAADALLAATKEKGQ
jgi:hypothetical protein